MLMTSTLDIMTILGMSGMTLVRQTRSIVQDEF